MLKKTQANGENQPETEVDESITQYDFDGNVTLLSNIRFSVLKLTFDFVFLGLGSNDRLLKAKVFKYLIRED